MQADSLDTGEAGRVFCNIHQLSQQGVRHHVLIVEVWPLTLRSYISCSPQLAVTLFDVTRDVFSSPA